MQPGDGFIAWPGYANDGRRFVAAALAAGAATCLVEEAASAAFGFEDARIATLTSMKAATGQIAATFFDEPSEKLAVVATTGTNGKTSTAWWTAQTLNLLGRRTGFVGTLGVGVPPLPPRWPWATRRRTGRSARPASPRPTRCCCRPRSAAWSTTASRACAIEASSIGIVEHRLAGTRIEVALFTNFTRDHLDYHGSMDAYWAAKRLLFGWVGLKAAVVEPRRRRRRAARGRTAPRLARPVDVLGARRQRSRGWPREDIALPRRRPRLHARGGAAAAGGAAQRAECARR